MNTSGADPLDHTAQKQELKIPCHQGDDRSGGEKGNTYQKNPAAPKAIPQPAVEGHEHDKRQGKGGHQPRYNIGLQTETIPDGREGDGYHGIA